MNDVNQGKTPGSVEGTIDPTDALAWAPMAIVITQRGDGAVIYGNELAGQLLGCSRGALIGRKIGQFIVGPGQHQSMLRDLDGNASIIRREMQMRRHDGDEFTAMLHLTRMRHGGQDAVQIMFEDISQRKSEEFELTASHQLLQSLIDGMPEFIALKDAKGRYLFVNKVFEEWYGISRAQAIGTTMYDYLSQDEADLYRQEEYRASKEQTLDSQTKCNSYMTGNCNGHRL
jgi:PAS domain S-box-containing protein